MLAHNGQATATRKRRMLKVTHQGGMRTKNDILDCLVVKIVIAVNFFIQLNDGSL